MIKIAIGKHEKSNELLLKEVNWQQIVKKYSAHKVCKTKGGEYVIGGEFANPVRNEGNLVSRSLLVIDIDSYSGTIDELGFDLSLSFSCAFVAYSSFRHTSDQPRIRVIAELSRPVTPDEYRVMARQACEGLLIPFDAIDKCSWTPNQAMFAPQCKVGADVWVMVQEGNPFPVPDTLYIEPAIKLDEFEVMIAAQPLDLLSEQVDAYLVAYPSIGRDYDAWIKVGMALWHQFQGANDGFERWVEWSKADTEKFNAEIMRSKWNSFGGSANPVTMASIIKKVKDLNGVVSYPDVFDNLLTEASNIKTLTEYDDFSKRIRAMSEIVLPPVRRGIIIQELVDGFGKEANVGKAELKKELAPNKNTATFKTTLPDWLEPWVYVENTCSFANSEVADYNIKREAFNAKFDRNPECVAAERQASQLALVNYHLKTVVDTMFFPKADKFFTYEHKPMMNSYSQKGVKPAEIITPEGQEAIDLFLKHLAFTLEDSKEQALFLNWMAYIYQNPGERVGWAMLLQGAQGTGKSYFGNVFEMLMGTNVKSLDTGAISGRFTGWATGALVTIVEEIRITGQNKWEITDKLKPIISNNTIQIEEKGRDHRTVPNFTSYFLLTNHKDAVPIQDGDRRYCVLFSRVQSEEQLFSELGGKEKARIYFDNLFNSMKNHAEFLAKFLLDYKICPSFDPIGRAPETSARIEMKAMAVSPDRDIVENALEKHKCSVINDHIIDVTWLNKLVKKLDDGDELPKTRTISSILSEMGFSPIQGRRVKISGNGYHFVWSRGAISFDHVKRVVADFHMQIEEGNYENIPF